MTGGPEIERLAAAREAPGSRPPADPDDAGSQFDALYTTYKSILRGIAVRRFGVPGKDADDLVQDVFASYLAHRGSVHDAGRYLVGAICNASRHYRRRDDASPFSPRPEHRECGSTSHDDVIDGVIRTLAVRTTLSRLGPKCRETLEEFYLLGERTGDIAERRQTSTSYICKLLNRCRNRARSIYEEMRAGS